MRPHKDHLLDRTERALREAMALSKEHDRLCPTLVFEVGQETRSFPGEMEDFLATISAAQTVACRQRLVGSMGSAFLLFGMSLREEVEVHPDRMAEQRDQWDSTVQALLRAIRPQHVVLIDCLTAGPLGIPATEPRAPALLALGLHPAKIIGLAAAREPRTGPIEFGPIVAVEDGAVLALSREWYTAIFSPGKS